MNLQFIETIENTLSPPEIFNTSTEAQVTDHFDANTIENTNTPLQTKDDFLDLTTAQEQINTLNIDKCIKEFIIQQLYVFKNL